MSDTEKQKQKVIQMARELNQTVAQTEQSFRDAIAAAVDEGKDLAQHLAKVPEAERVAWLQRNFPGTRKLASALIRLAQNPPTPDAPVADLIPIAVALFAEGRK